MNFKKLLFGLLTGTRNHLNGALILFVASVLIFGFGRYSSAEEQTDDYVLEDTLVTATKTGETRLQETPIAITAFSDEHLDSINIDDLTSLSQYVPNSEFSQFGPGFTTAFIRGIGTTSVTSGSQAAVGFYVDGVFLERGFAADATFFDLERIEVLRGPQGTLYGRNTTGGAVNIITKKPSDELEFNIGVELGDYSKRRIDATISGPIIKDKMKARVSFVKSKHDAYVENLTGPDTLDEDFEGARGAIELTLTDKLDIILRGDYFSQEPHSPANRLMTWQGLFPAIAGAMGLSQAPTDFYTVDANGLNLNRKRTWGLSGTVELELPHNQTLRSITAYRKLENFAKQDVDLLPVTLFHITQDMNWTTFTQEFQINGSSDRWKWVAGLFYIQNEEWWDEADYEMFFIIPGLLWGRVGKVDSWSWAGYGNLVYSLSDRFSVEAGIRYSYEEVTNKYFRSYTNVPAPPFPPVDLSGDKSRDWDDFTPSFKLSYQLSDDALLYGIYSEGFKSGYFYMPQAPPDYWINPENVTSYEAGFKSDWLDRRLRLNGAIFHLDYEDMQVKTHLATGPIVKNAAESTVQGAELELLARPIPALTLNGSVSFLDAEFDRFLAADPDRNPVDVSGNSMPYAPEWKTVFGAQYVLNVGDYGFLTFRGDVTWSDEMYFDQFNNPLASRGELTLLDGFVRFETADGHWSFEAYGKNLTEEEYLLGTAELFGDIQGFIAPPRTVGAQFVYRY